MSDAPGHLADNLRQLRRARSLTQQALAKAAGVPRPTLTTLESGAGNPTLVVLIKLATALRVSLEELVAPPRESGRLWRAAELPTTHRGGAEVRKLLPEAVPGLAFERISLAVGAALTGTPHVAGTREFLTCERGRIDLVTAGARYGLTSGDVVSFRGDQRHSYRNAGASIAVGLSVVVLANMRA